MPLLGGDNQNLEHLHQQCACHGSWCCIMPGAACQLHYVLWASLAEALPVQWIR